MALQPRRELGRTGSPACSRPRSRWWPPSGWLGCPNLAVGGHHAYSGGSAFETVVVIVFERLEGVLDVVRHDALVRAALVRRRGVYERRLGAVQVPAREVDAQRHVQALPRLDRGRRGQRRFLTLVDIGREGEAGARARLTVRARHADRDGRKVGVSRDERRVLAGGGLMDLELQRGERARRRGDGHLLRDGRAAERQRHERGAGLELFAVVVPGDRIAGRDVRALELDLAQHDLRATNDDRVVAERDQRAVAGGGHAGRGGGEREAHGSGIGVGASGKRERQRQRNQCHVLHTSSSTRFGRLRLRSSRHQGGKRCAACGPAGARPPRARRVRDLTCVHDTWQVSLYQIGANAARHEPGGIMKPSPREQADAFRQLHTGPRILVLPNAWDVASARLVEEAGFPAIATTSAGIAWALGYADGERISRGEMLAVIRRIVTAVRVPVTADVEGGYGATVAAAGEAGRGGS